MSVQVSTRRFTVEEYQRMGEAGILGEDDRVELIDGRVSLRPSPYRPLARLERAFPSLGRGARLALRHGRLAAALVIAVPLSAAISREIERHAGQNGGRVHSREV